MSSEAPMSSEALVSYPIITAPVAEEETIKIFARIRPCRTQLRLKGYSEEESRNKYYRLDPDSDSDHSGKRIPQLHFFLPKAENQGLINHSREKYDFWFHRIFNEVTTQDEVFDVAAKEVVDRYTIN